MLIGANSDGLLSEPASALLGNAHTLPGYSKLGSHSAEVSTGKHCVIITAPALNIAVASKTVGDESSARVVCKYEGSLALKANASRIDGSGATSSGVIDVDGPSCSKYASLECLPATGEDEEGGAPALENPHHDSETHDIKSHVPIDWLSHWLGDRALSKTAGCEPKNVCDLAVLSVVDANAIASDVIGIVS